MAKVKAELGDFFRHPEKSEKAQRYPIERATIRQVRSFDPYAVERGDLAQVLVQDYLIAPWGTSWWRLEDIGERIAQADQNATMRTVLAGRAAADADAEVARLRAAIPQLAARVRQIAISMGDNFAAHGETAIAKAVAAVLANELPENAGRHEAPRMMPGQEPYTPEELAEHQRRVAEAAAGDPGEADEPELRPGERFGERCGCGDNREHDRNGRWACVSCGTYAGGDDRTG